MNINMKLVYSGIFFILAFSNFLSQTSSSTNHNAIFQGEIAKKKMISHEKQLMIRPNERTLHQHAVHSYQRQGRAKAAAGGAGNLNNGHPPTRKNNAPCSVHASFITLSSFASFITFALLLLHH